MDKSLILIQAKNAVMAHDFMTAARLYKELLKDDPSNVEYLKQLGSIYVQAQEDEKAIPYYEQIITFYPHYVDAMNSLGAIYRRLKRYDESIQILQRALEEDRQLPDVNYNLGFTYKEMGNYADAIEAFEMVIHAKPDDVLAYNHLGSIYLAQKNYEKSIASYRRGLQIDRNHPILNYNLARAYEQSGNETEAIRCYQLALKTRPGWKDCISDYSNLLLKCQKNKEASDLVNQAIKMHPNDGDLLYILGQVYLNEYDYKKAESTFKKADNLKGNDVKILSGLAKAMEKGEKPEQALETVLSALEIDPYNKDIRKQYVEVLLDTADYEKAFENVKQLYDAGGDKDLQVLDLYGQYYITQNEEENAKPYYDKIQKINHHYKDHIVNAAERFNQIGNYDKAEFYAKEFVRQRPNLPDGYNMLGKISSEKGNLAEAKKYYSQSQNVAKPNHLADEKLSQIEKQISELSEQKTETPVLPEVEETPVVQNEVVENPVAEEKSEDEEFDYAVMGGNIPLQEGLVEKEGDFWGDEEKEPEDEAETEDKKSENPVQENNSAPASLENSGKSDNAENLKSLDGENSGNAAENKSGAENPKNFAENGNSGLAENAENSDFADDDENLAGNKNATENQNAESEMKMPDDDGLSLNDLVNPDDDKFDFDDFTGKKSDDENFENPAENHENSVENATPEIPENANVTQNPLENSENFENPAVAQPAAEEIANPEVEAKDEPETKAEDDFDFADFGGQKTEEENQKNYQPYKNPADDYEKYKAQEDYAQSGYINPDSEAMKAALKAQQMAEQLADEQFLLRKENENSIQDALDQLRKMNEQHLEELKMQNQELKNQLKEAQNSEPVLEEDPQP
jgi:tetratricopeptide (TPR) repeat protein